MTKIAIAARYADDTPYGHGRLTIRLVDGGSGAALPNGLGVTPRTVNLDADGEAIVDLTPNADISDPVGTFYAVTVNDSTPTVVRYIEVPAPNGSGNSEIPYDWDDDTIQRLAVNPPTSIPAPGSGTVGEVLTLVDDGDGKRYELAPPGNTLPTQTGNSGKFLTTDGTTASWGDVTATIDGYLHTDVAFRPVDTSGTYPASDIDPIADTAAWVSAGGPAFFNVTPGDRVAVNNYNFDPTTTGIYDWDGTTFARAADVASVAQFDKKIIVSHVHHSHFTGAPLTTPIPIAVMFFADDPDGEMGEVSWLGKIFMDFESVVVAAPLLVSAGGGVLTGDSRLSDARTPTAHKTSHATGGGDALAPSDIGAVPTSRQIAGLDLTADRSASAVAAALPMWQTIANTTLGSASGSQSFNITGYRFVRITVAARSNRNGSIDSIRLRFNGDTGSNYSTNTGAFTSFITAVDIAGEYTNTDRSGYVVIQFGYMAGSWLTGTVMGTGPSSTATTAANSLSNGFAWKGATSAAPTSIEVYTALGQFVAGSSFLVEGRT